MGVYQQNQDPIGGYMYILILSLVPRLVRGRGEKSLVHTVCACSVFPGFLGIWKLL